MTTDIPFPKTFQPQCKKILTRLYRVFVHVYVHHFDRIMSIGAEPHVNTCYKHFYYFVTEFDLINEKEFAPLQEMTRKICTDIIAPPTPTGCLTVKTILIIKKKISFRTSQTIVSSGLWGSLRSSSVTELKKYSQQFYIFYIILSLAGRIRFLRTNYKHTKHTKQCNQIVHVKYSQ